MCRYLAAREHRTCDERDHNLIDVWEGRAHPVREVRREWRDVDPTVFGAARTGKPVGEDAYPLQTMLAALVADSAGPHCTITRVRGAQAALQLHGWRLELPNLAYAVGLGLTTTPLTTALITRIRTGLASPIRCAALVLALFTGATFGELSMIYTDHLDPTTTLLDTGRHRRVYVVPPIARPLLAAAAVHAKLTKPDRKGLFVASTGSQGGKLRTAADQCQIVLPARHTWTDTWISGIRVRPHPSATERRSPLCAAEPGLSTTGPSAGLRSMSGRWFVEAVEHDWALCQLPFTSVLGSRGSRRRAGRTSRWRRTAACSTRRSGWNERRTSRRRARRPIWSWPATWRR